MTFSQSADIKKLAQELALLESLSEKAIRGMMVEDDFKKLYHLFGNVKKNEYEGYGIGILGNLSNENLHKLIAGMIKVAAKEAQGANINTFLRDDHLLKFLMAQEGYRYFINHGIIPNSLLNHYANLLKDPDCVKAFGNTIQEQQTNIITSINFNFGYKLNPKLLTIENGKLVLKAPSLKFTPMQPMSEDGIVKSSKEMARRAIDECSKNPAYKKLISARTNLDKLDKTLATQFEAKPTRAQQKELNNLIKQHKSLRKEAGVTYELAPGNKFYDLIMSGNEKTIERLISKMMINNKDYPKAQSTPQMKMDLDAVFRKSPPELLLKMNEIAEKLEARQGGHVSNFRDGINKFANGIKRIFSFGLAGIGDKNIKEALLELGNVSLSASSDRIIEDQEKGFKEKTAGRFIESLSNKPKDKTQEPPVVTNIKKKGERDR